MIPLFAYLGETLVVPAINGAIGRRGFWEHAAITAGVAGAIAAMWFVLTSLGGRNHSKAGTWNT